MIFLTQHQIEKLVPQCPFAKDSYEIIFTYLIKNIQFESFQTILSQHFERYRLYNPYAAENMSEDNIFFEYNNKKYSVFKDIRPKFSLSMKSKEDFFKFVLFKMELEKENVNIDELIQSTVNPYIEVANLSEKELKLDLKYGR